MRPRSSSAVGSTPTLAQGTAGHLVLRFLTVFDDPDSSEGDRSATSWGASQLGSVWRRRASGAAGLWSPEGRRCDSHTWASPGRRVSWSRLPFLSSMGHLPSVGARVSPGRADVVRGPCPAGNHSGRGGAEEGRREEEQGPEEATMQSWSRVRVAKCQLLVTSSFVLLLGLSMAAMAAVNYLGTHFAVVGRASSDRTPYEATRRWAFCTSISLAGLLTLGAVLGAVATVREAGGLMAGGFLCFALAFCMLVQVAFWRFHNPAQVEGAVLDTYDLVYDQAVRSSSVTLRQQLVAIQDTFLCCGKNSPFGLLGGMEVSLCPGEEATRQDCLVGVRSFLRTYGNIASTLTGIGLASTVYAVLLSSFLWFAFRSGCGLDRRGKYTLSRRARDCRPQEPSFFRRSPGGPALRHPMEADVLDGRLRASRPSGGPQFLQDS